MIGGSSVAVFLLTAGETVRFLRPLALLSPRARSKPSGVDGEANDFEINKTFAASGIEQSATGGEWRLVLQGGWTLSLSRDELLSMPQSTAVLPIACVEGWSTVQRWSGVRLAYLAHLVGVERAVSAFVDSLEKPGEPFRSVTLSADQVWDPLSLLALRVNGGDLSLDHGFPARIVIPAAPGVHCTKWVSQIAFGT